jgi:hypothetical protein
MVAPRVEAPDGLGSFRAGWSIKRQRWGNGFSSGGAGHRFANDSTSRSLHLLCTAKSDTTVKYATGGMDNQLFVSKYQSVLPTVEQLQQWLQGEKEYLLQLAEAKEENE